MGRIAKHTDLSWEFPGLRAEVDVPLEEPTIPLPSLVTRTGTEWRDGRDPGSLDERAVRQWPRPLSAVLAQILLRRVRRRTRRGR
jgi:hypothetical protein